MADIRALKACGSNTVRVQISLPAPIKLCSWCKINPVKLEKNNTCSISCGRMLYWFKNKDKIIPFLRGVEYGKRTAYAKRIRIEYLKACEELELEPSDKLRKFYIRSRNVGYKRGWSTRDRRSRRE